MIKSGYNFVFYIVVHCPIVQSIPNELVGTTKTYRNPSGSLYSLYISLIDAVGIGKMLFIRKFRVTVGWTFALFLITNMNWLNNRFFGVRNFILSILIWFVHDDSTMTGTRSSCFAIILLASAFLSSKLCICLNPICMKLRRYDIVDDSLKNHQRMHFDKFVFITFLSE